MSSGIRLPSSAMSVWVSCGACPEDAAVEPAGSGIGVLLGSSVSGEGMAGESRRVAAPTLPVAIAALDRALLVEGLKVADHLGNHPGQLAHHFAHVLLRELALLAPALPLAAEARLAERLAAILTERLAVRGLPGAVLPRPGIIAVTVALTDLRRPLQRIGLERVQLRALL